MKPSAFTCRRTPRAFAALALVALVGASACSPLKVIAQAGGRTSSSSSKTHKVAKHPKTMPSVIRFSKATVWQSDDIAASNGGFDVSKQNVVAAVTKDAAAMQAAGVTWARWWVGPGDSVQQETTVAKIYKRHGVNLELDVNYGSNSSAANEQTLTNWLATMVPAMSAVGVHFWEIGNEPNINYTAGGYWDTCRSGTSPNGASNQGDATTAVASYVVRLKDAYTAIHRFDSSAFVSSAGLSYDSGYSAYCEIPSDQWINALTQTNASSYMDCFGIHPYASSASGVISALADTRNALNANSNYSKIPFCITEVGFWANGYAPGSQNGFIGTNDENARASSYLSMMQSLKSYGIKTPVFWYTWYDYSQPTGYGVTHYSGITSRTYSPLYWAMARYTA